jgi:hypothetical protein
MILVVVAVEELSHWWRVSCECLPVMSIANCPVRSKATIRGLMVSKSFSHRSLLIEWSMVNIHYVE